jgi:integration host factor subunit beta
MTKSELIEKIAKKQPHLPYKDVELSVKTLIEQMAQKLSTGNRIEIRGKAWHPSRSCQLRQGA